MTRDSKPDFTTEPKERFDALDAAIAAAVVQAQVPEGLADRLLATLHSAEAHSAELRSAEAPSAPAHSASTASGSFEPMARDEGAETTIPSIAGSAGKQFRHAARRHWRLAGAVAALAAAACVAAIWAFRPPQPLNYDQVVAEANAFDAAAPANAWKTLTNKSRPHKWYSISSAISATPTGWKGVAAFLGRTGVAYNVVSGTGAQGVLYVVPLNPVGRQDVQGIGQSPPNRPHMTGGRATAAWTDGTRLWVLVVQGGQQEYRSFRQTGFA